MNLGVDVLASELGGYVAGRLRVAVSVFYPERRDLLIACLFKIDLDVLVHLCDNKLHRHAGVAFRPIKVVLEHHRFERRTAQNLLIDRLETLGKVLVR